MVARSPPPLLEHSLAMPGEIRPLALTERAGTSAASLGEAEALKVPRGKGGRAQDGAVVGKTD